MACRPQPTLPTNPPPGVVPPGSFVHYLRADERLDDVARRYRRTPDAIIAANRLKPYDMVYEGFPLRIPPLDNRWTRNETASAQPNKRPIGRMPPKEMIKPPPKDNDTTDTEATTRKLPGNVTPKPHSPEVSRATAGKTSKDGFRWPVIGVIERAFTVGGDDPFHGVAIGAARGSQIVAARAGKVLGVFDNFEGYGSMIIIDHSDSYATVYANIEAPRVKEGERVAAGHVIAGVGPDKESVNGASLRFEIRKNATAVDPIKLLPKL